MKHRDVFLQAVQRILDDRNELACISIREASDELSVPWLMWVHCSSLFAELFEPPSSDIRPRMMWWPHGDKESRVLALLLAAEISEEES